MSLISGFESVPRAKKPELARLLEEKKRLFGNRLRRHRYDSQPIFGFRVIHINSYDCASILRVRCGSRPCENPIDAMVPLLNRGGMMKGFVQEADRQQTTLLHLLRGVAFRSRRRRRSRRRGGRMLQSERGGDEGRGSFSQAWARRRRRLQPAHISTPPGSRSSRTSLRSSGR
jgi:hypothetical protein